ncbi:uncharacterized protein PV09_06505 [Verruconis gallopava]|uniref:MARVEL domain-containing protein n=1 Tax=Verruconis gallopava TaxID=253628 RepID=A0A0D2A641_9PEZI|nr:uncharacterized protein PV09_06505 [Verruconis gallopava]KIW01995.1 hypothetical protein PV09_06505 [Verruconis gallopava]
MGDSHIVPMPKGFLAVRILQIVFALIVVGLTAFLISNTIGFVFSATAFGIFCGILTLIIVTYDLVAEKAAKAAYNMWAVLALDILMVIFWLSAMGSMAALRAAFTVPVTITTYKRVITKRYYYAWAGNTYLAILAGAAGVSAIELILFIISLIMFGARLHRHRTSSRGTTNNGLGASNVSPEKIEMQPGAQQYQAPPQQAPSPAPTPAPAQMPAPSAYPNYQPPAMQSTQPMQPQHNDSHFTPASPIYTGQPPYQPAMSPPPQGYPSPTASPQPQFVQPMPQYLATPPPQGYHEAPGHPQGPR